MEKRKIVKKKIVKKKIKRITISKNQDVYDISTAKNHNFFANGILVHNCGEQFLIPYLSCNLSAINISKFVNGINDFDWDGLYDTAKNVMLLMDNLIDKMEFPDQRFKDNVMKYRPVGIGPMGLADAMFMLNYKYDGPDGRKFAGDVMRTITTACIDQSNEITKEKGPFHDYKIFKDDMERIVEGYIDNDKVLMDRIREHGLRNSQHTTCMPSGTTALSCDCSYGIEPCFGLVFQKNLISGDTMMIVNPVFENRFKEEEWYDDNLVERIFNNGGSLKHLRGIPQEVRDIFVVAHDIKHRDRIDIQAELQKYCSTAISSTINLPKETTVDEISKIYQYAYEKGLKGVTIYRDGSKRQQPVTFKPKQSKFIRPAKLSSNTFTIDTGNGKLYVTVSDYKGKPLEMFINCGKGGQILNTFSEALGRVISIALQNGVSIEDITKTLIGINSDVSVWYRFEEGDKKPAQILSIPDGIAQLLNRYYGKIKYGSDMFTEICPTCGSHMMPSEGCWNCICGYSKCS